jgi:dipeptidyl aminopeptidase/acylaminoacyl peptidase
VLLRHILVLLAVLSLAACGGAPLVEQATAESRQTAGPAAPALPTAAPPSRETFAPPPTQASIPEQATTLPPTQPPAPAQATALPPTEPPTQPPAPTALPPTQPAATVLPVASFGSEILFLRKSALIAFDIATRKERQLADRVIDFAAAPDGAMIALVRDLGKGDPNTSGIDLWIVQRDGGRLTQLTKDGVKLIEATPAWSPDGAALAYAASQTNDPYTRTWEQWSAWCRPSEVHIFDLSSSSDQSFGPGCDPAFSPDGKRIAYATPPNARQENASILNTVNSIRLINRQGQNGWNFAAANGSTGNDSAKSGLLVYAPAWSPDGQQIVYHRYLGYQALVDLDLTEIAGSFDGKGQPLDSGAGWLLPARFAPDHQSLAITENNVGDARGFGGYDNWAVTVTRLGGTREIALPTGALTVVGQRVDRLPRGQAAAWSPDGAALAVELPPGWNANLAPDQPVNAEDQPGEIWRWQPGSAPSELLVPGVDFASPLAWLAPLP